MPARRFQGRRYLYPRTAETSRSREAVTQCCTHVTIHIVVKETAPCQLPFHDDEEKIHSLFDKKVLFQ